MTISRILVPTDFSADADAALKYACDLARTFRASVQAINVVENPLAVGAWSPDAYTAEIAGLQIGLVRDAQARLEKTVAALADTGLETVTEVRTGHAANEIVKAAREAGVDLIVMGTTGRTGVAHLIMGSVAERVVRHALCPVLTLRAHAAGATEQVA